MSPSKIKALSMKTPRIEPVLKAAKLLALIFALGITHAPTAIFGCDDTLVMLLTSQNPASEFSKAIRSFTTSLTVLGTTLKENKKDNFETELKTVMDSWLEFSKRYMTNPPEEARNDLKWVEKTQQTAKMVGEIRQKISGGEIVLAHNLVLDLSSRIGSFFESVGVSDEKQLFIKTSSNLMNLERLVLENNYSEALTRISDLKADLESFRSLIPQTASPAFSLTSELLGEIEVSINGNSAPDVVDAIIIRVKSGFEELRSHILMQEWFPGAVGQ